MITLALIKQVILDQRDELAQLHKQLIARDLSPSNVKKFLSKPNLVVISGVRRCGKSVYATTIFDEPFGYINFDDERLIDFKAEHLNLVMTTFFELYGGDLKCFVFDEIQNILGWELFANRIRRTGRVIITGSNASLLSSELATALTGRYLEVVLFPFSFREYLKRVEVTAIDANAVSTRQVAEFIKHCNAYLSTGGFPEAYDFGGAYCRTIFNNIIEKDIVGRHRIRRHTTFRKVAHYLLSMHSKEIALAKVGRLFGIKDPHTVANYASYLTSAFLLFTLPRFSYKLKQQQLANKKTYAIDSGIINAMSFNATQDIGSVYENVVYIELLRRRAYYESFEEIFFWQEANRKHEVDFVLRDKRKFVALIQVTYLIDNPDTLDRELSALVVASKEMRCDTLYLITGERDEVLEYGGKSIHVVPLWRWLLGEGIPQ